MDIGKMWDEKFTRDDYFYGKKPNAFLASNLDRLKPNSSIIFLGEGEGRTACFAATKSFEVTALDASMVGLSKCEALARELDVKLSVQQADLENYTYTQKYDAIFTSFLHLFEPLRTKALRQAIEALNSGGLFVAEFFSIAQMPRESGGPKNIELLYSIESLEAILKPLHVKIIQLEEVEDLLDEGDGHQGLAMLIRVIIQKI